MDHPDVIVIVITAFGTIAGAVEAMNPGLTTMSPSRYNTMC
jgi:ActR/RegA family two-component response regulator